MNFTFLHAADLHLDTPFKGLGKVHPGLAGELRDASLATLDRIVELAIAERVLFVIFAGDVYDGAERGVRAQLRFAAALRRLDKAGIRTFVAHGNHDPAIEQWSAIGNLPGSVTVFPPGRLTSCPLGADGAQLACVHGVSYGSAAARENLSQLFPVARGTGLQVGVLHCTVGGLGEDSKYSATTLDDLRSRAIDYWALGHIHSWKVLNRDPWIVYPGNTQGRGFGPEERGPKGVVLVTVVEGRVESAKAVTTDGFRFLDVPLDIGSLAALADLSEGLEAALDTIARENPRVDLVLRARLTGRSPVHTDLRRLDRLEELLDQLPAATAAGNRVIWTAVSDDTRSPLDIEAIRQGADLRAAVLRAADGWQPANRPKPLHEALRVLPDDYLGELVREAAIEAVERLDEGRNA